MKQEKPYNSDNSGPSGPIRVLAQDDDYISLVKELYGIDEENIRVDLENDIVTVSWTDRFMKTCKEQVRLPSKVRLSKKKFQNGRLEILLEKLPDNR
jgi:HSP20 family molecular chaperone IbpA